MHGHPRHHGRADTQRVAALLGISRLVLVTPCTEDVQQRIIDNYRALGIEVVAEHHLGICVNHDFALVEPETLRELMKEVAAARPQAITTFCTNLHAARLAGEIEAELGIPLLDTVNTTARGMLRAAGTSSMAGAKACNSTLNRLIEWPAAATRCLCACMPALCQSYRLPLPH